jgi:transcriptional regulator with XRE-family HTH domain
VKLTRGGTSQPTIALYEAGTKSPTLATLERLASSLALDLVVTFTPRLTREDQRSLAYHQAIARMLRRDSVSTIRRAKRTLQRTSRRNLGAKALFDRWGLWLELRSGVPAAPGPVLAGSERKGAPRRSYNCALLIGAAVESSGNSAYPSTTDPFQSLNSFCSN